jgi:phosphoglycolate phosphatase
MKHDALVFDLDGTLWNSCAAVAVGWTEGLKELGIPRAMTAEHIASICGLPTPDCIRRLCPEIKEESLEQAMDVLGRYEKEFLLKMGGILYPNVLEGLKYPQTKHRIFLVSNCQEWYLKCFFELHGASHLFEDWECYGRTKKSKGENLKSIALRNNLKQPLYVGDIEGDYLASQFAAYDFAFVSYGSGSFPAENAYSDFSKFVESYS